MDKSTLLLLICAGGFCYGDNHCSSIDPRKKYDCVVENFIHNNTIVENEVLDEILRGDGFVILSGLFEDEDIVHARETIHYLISKQGDKATHFQGGKDSKPELQARVWNLLNKGRVFEKMVQHPTYISIVRKILGDDMQLGSIASNTIFPGGSGQEPHIDYPYWDYYNKNHWPFPPKHKDIPFNMNTQVLIPLDDMTAENGATSLRPKSHLEIEYPSDVKEYRSHEKRVLAKAGDVVIFVGLVQHCAMPNFSQNSRSVILIQYLPKWVRPMEDQKGMLKPEVKDRASDDLRRLLLLDYPYPAILDEEDSGNTEGSESDFKWKD